MLSPPAIRVVDIAFTAYPVTDMGRARRFYEGTLGLHPSRKYGDGKETFVEYDIGHGTLGLGSGVEIFKPSRGGGMIVLEVADLDTAVARLKIDNVALIFPPFDAPSCRGVAVSDPDGNSVMLHQRKPAS